MMKLKRDFDSVCTSWLAKKEQEFNCILILYLLLYRKKISLLPEFNSNAIKFGLPCPVLSSNLAYYDLIFSKHKIGETIQLQRSFFGLHPLKNKKNNDKIKPYWTKL